MGKHTRHYRNVSARKSRSWRPGLSVPPMSSVTLAFASTASVPRSVCRPLTVPLPSDAHSSKQRRPESALCVSLCPPRDTRAQTTPSVRLDCVTMKCAKSLSTRNVRTMTTVSPAVVTTPACYLSRKEIRAMNQVIVSRVTVSTTSVSLHAPAPTIVVLVWSVCLSRTSGPSVWIRWGCLSIPAQTIH